MAREKTGQRHKNKIYFKVQDLYLQAFPLNHLSYCGGAAGEVFYAASCAPSPASALPPS